MIHLKSIYFFVLLCLLMSCKKDKDAITVQLHTDYAGMESSRFITYEAIEIFHDDASGVHDTSKYLLKSKVGQTFIDEAGKLNHEIIRFKSIDNGTTWILKDVWNATISDNRFEIVEENQRKVRMIFAPKLKAKWDLNIYNTEPSKEIAFIEIHKKKNVGVFSFDSTVTVEEGKLFTLVDYKKQTEVYAKGIGLVDKYFKDLTISNFDTLDVKRGYEYYLKLKSFGFE